MSLCLSEMLFGKNPFQRETTGDVIAAILTENPPTHTLESDVPVEFQRILSKVLQKKRDDRYQTSRDFLLDLKSLRREIEFSETAERTGRGKIQPTKLIAGYATNADRDHSGGFLTSRWLLIFLGACLICGAAWWFYFRSEVENNEARKTLQSAPATVEIVNWRSTPGEVYSTGVFSPDAKMIAFSSTKTGAKNIWVKQISGGEAVQITKDDFTNTSPIWSPDNRTIYFGKQTRYSLLSMVTNFK